MSQKQDTLGHLVFDELTGMRKSVIIRVMIALKKVDMSQDEKVIVKEVKKIVASAIKETTKVYESKRTA